MHHYESVKISYKFYRFYPHTWGRICEGDRDPPFRNGAACTKVGNTGFRSDGLCTTIPDARGDNLWPCNPDAWTTGQLDNWTQRKWCLDDPRSIEISTCWIFGTVQLMVGMEWFGDWGYSKWSCNLSFFGIAFFANLKVESTSGKHRCLGKWVFLKGVQSHRQMMICRIKID